MGVSVHLVRVPDSEQIERLPTLLDPAIELTMGKDLGNAPSFEILVNGFPDRGQIEASPRLHTLVIPFAGLPKRTRDVMNGFPDVAIHNIHYNAGPTAEMAVSLMLAAAKSILPVDRSFRKHVWAPPGKASGSALIEGRTVLILGYGDVGRRVARACRGLDMKILATRRTPGLEDGPEVFPASSLHSLLPRANVLMVCLPQTDETEGLIGKTELAMLPPEAILVNVGRGIVIDEEALFNGLRDGTLYAAGLDVWYSYPKIADREGGTPFPPSRFPFHELDNVVMSPHRAGWTEETEKARVEHLARLLNHAARGEPMPNRIDPGHGY